MDDEVCNNSEDELWCGASALWCCPLSISPELPETQKQDAAARQPFLAIISDVQKTQAWLVDQNAISDVSSYFCLEVNSSSIYCSGMLPMPGQFVLIQVTPNGVNLCRLDAINSLLQSTQQGEQATYPRRNSSPMDSNSASSSKIQAQKKNRRSLDHKQEQQQQQELSQEMQQQDAWFLVQSNSDIVNVADQEDHLHQIAVDAAQGSWQCPQGCVISCASTCQDLVLCSCGRQNLILWFQVRYSTPTWKNLWSRGMQSKRKRAYWYLSKRGERKMSYEIIASSVWKDTCNNSGKQASWMTAYATHDKHIGVARLHVDGRCEELACLDYTDLHPEYLAPDVSVTPEDGYLQDMWNWKIDGLLNTLSFVCYRSNATVDILAGVRTGQVVLFRCTDNKLQAKSVHHLSATPVSVSFLCQDPRWVYFIVSSPQNGYLAKYQLSNSALTFVPIQDRSLTMVVPLPYSNINLTLSNQQEIQQSVLGRDNGFKNVGRKSWVGSRFGKTQSMEIDSPSSKNSQHVASGMEWAECKSKGKVVGVDSAGILRIFSIDLYRKYKITREHELWAASDNGYGGALVQFTALKLVFDPCFDMVLALGKSGDSEFASHIFSMHPSEAYIDSNHALSDLINNNSFGIKDMCLWKDALSVLPELEEMEDSSYTFLALQRLPNKQAQNNNNEDEDEKGKLILLRAVAREFDPIPNFEENFDLEQQPQQQPQLSISFMKVVGVSFMEPVVSVSLLTQCLLLLGVGGRIVLTEIVVEFGKISLEKVQSVNTEMSTLTPLVKAVTAAYDPSIFLAIVQNSASMIMQGSLSTRGMQVLAVDCDMHQVQEAHMLTWSPHIEVLVIDKNGQISILAFKEDVHSPEMGMQVQTTAKFVGMPVGCQMLGSMPSVPSRQQYPKKHYCLWIPTVGGSVRMCMTTSPSENILLQEMLTHTKEPTDSRGVYKLCNGDKLQNWDLEKWYSTETVFRELQQELVDRNQGQVQVYTRQSVYGAMLQNATNSVNLTLDSGNNPFVHRLIHVYYQQ